MPNYKDWTIFLDRDGVVNKNAKEHDYIKSWDEFEFIPGAIDAILMLNDTFGRIVIVSNQQGIGEGIIEPFMLETINQRMLYEISRNGGNIDLTLYCHHLESDKCDCRKPQIGLAIKAKSIFSEIDFRKSVMIGDSISDMLFGLYLGSFKALIRNDMLDFSEFHELYDAHFDSLFDFARHKMLFSPNWRTPQESFIKWLPPYKNQAPV